MWRSCTALETTHSTGSEFAYVQISSKEGERLHDNYKGYTRKQYTSSWSFRPVDWHLIIYIM